MITAIIRNKENTLVLELPHSIYNIYEKLQSVGIMRSPKQIPLTDSEDEDIGVKLFSDNDFGRHLLFTLNEENTLNDANLLTLIVQAADEDIKEALEQDIHADDRVTALLEFDLDEGRVSVYDGTDNEWQTYSLHDFSVAAYKAFRSDYRSEECRREIFNSSLAGKELELSDEALDETDAPMMQM